MLCAAQPRRCRVEFSPFIDCWLNSICWGTNQQQVTPVLTGHKTAEAVWHTFVDQWIRVYGLPDVVVCDPGKEFEGHFAEMTQAYGITLLPTDARAPWQNGKTERAGSVWKHNFKVAQRKCPPPDQAEHEMLEQNPKSLLTFKSFSFCFLLKYISIKQYPKHV